ncbi:MAG TPA: O-antigen ligase family protein [Chloroflexota bacterium]|nr:O-antigen ligase family protein [Chloroflexota bacterium]
MGAALVAPAALLICGTLLVVLPNRGYLSALLAVLAAVAVWARPTSGAAYASAAPRCKGAALAVDRRVGGAAVARLGAVARHLIRAPAAWGTCLLLIGSIAGTAASALPALSLQKLWAIIVGIALFGLLARLSGDINGNAAANDVDLAHHRPKGGPEKQQGDDLSHPALAGDGKRQAAASRAAVLPVLWMLVGFGVLLGIAADVQVDRNSWKLNAYNRAVYSMFAHIPRLSTVALNQNAIAAWFIVIAPLALCLALGPWRRGARVLGSALAISSLFQLSLTNSRAALLALGVGLLAGAWVLGGHWRWIGASALGALLALLVSGLLGEPFRLTLLPTGGSSRERLAIWNSALHMLAAAPFTGTGLGLFQRVYPAFMLPGERVDYPHAHNLLLQAGTDMGLLGIVGWLILTAWAACVTIRLCRRPPKDPATRCLAAGAVAASAGLLAHAQVDCYFAGDSHTIFFLFVPLGLLAATARPPARQTDSSTRRIDLNATRSRRGGLIRGRLPAAGGLAGLALVALWASGWLPSELLLNRGTLAWLRSGLGNAGQTGLTAAIQDDRAAVALQPSNWAANQALGLSLVSDGQPQQAVAALQLATRLRPSDPLLELEMGNAQAAAGQPRAALESWGLAGAAPYLVSLGQGEARRGSTNASARWYAAALAISPGNPGASRGLAWLQTGKRDWTGAAVTLRRDLAAHHHDGVAQRLLAGLAWRAGDFSQARRLLNRALTVSGPDESLQRGLGLLDQSLGKPDQAAADDASAHATLAARGVPSPELGEIFFFAGLDNQAEREFRRVAYGQPADPIGHYWLGRLFIAQDQPSHALTELQMAVHAIPNQEQFLLALAEEQLRVRNRLAALHTYRAIRALDPSNAEAAAALHLPALPRT